ncbi:class I SAM-dependent DNA methyltransferase, partial [Candidatus Bipolaricaulota bacterium]|nr:class I SAM-dependent DNA methyltransferase [Candidatus Bipolaricaulota bacterium]
AHELAQATIWIGYIQWLRENGFGQPSEPILKALDNIQEMDAILAFNEDGNPVEPEWPAADVVIGNPPFLGSYRLRSELGDEYVEKLFVLYKGRIVGASDLCCYWFEKARAMIEHNKLQRVGLLATQGIRGSANRKTLERIKETGDIFWAQSDRDWILDGAAVHVSMIGFDRGGETTRELEGEGVQNINADLTSFADLTMRFRLQENSGISFMGPSAKAPFDVNAETAERLLSEAGNPHGRPNSDVVKPVYSAVDITKRPRGRWTIDFCFMPIEDASQYHAPFEYVKTHVLPVREAKQREKYRKRWWQYARPREDMRNALEGLSRYAATPGVSKHRVFVWVESR